MVAQVNIASGFEAAQRAEQLEQYQSVVRNIERQFDQLRAEPTVIRPFPLNIGMKNLFRSRPGDHLLISVTLDVPDDAWLSPADPYGKMRLNRYKQRTERPVPGTQLSWGKLNRIVMDIIGGRQIAFHSIPLTKESWYGTDDAYVAALLREHMRMATTVGFPGSSAFRDIYEVSGSRKYIVDGFEFDDTEIGHAKMIAYIQASGSTSIEVVTEGEDNPILTSVDAVSDMIVESPEDAAAAIARYQDEMERRREERTALFQAEQQARQAAILKGADPVQVAQEPAPLTPQQKAAATKAAKKKAQDSVPDSLEEFESMMGDKADLHPDLLSRGESVWETIGDDDGSVSDLIDEVSDGSPDETGPAADGGDGVDGLP
jgi:hypothetical protein